MRGRSGRRVSVWLAGCLASLIGASGLAVVSNVPAQSTEVFNEVPAAAQADWHAWWGTAVTFGGSTSMTANTTTERATKTLSLPAGSYTLELQGTAAAGVNVTPYFQSHTNWSNYQLPTEAAGASQGQLGAKSWTGSQTWPITMTGSGTHVDLRMVGTAAFTVTRIIIRTASTTTTTTTTPPVSGVELFNEIPAVASSNWHAWWGTAVSFAGTTSMTVNTTAERSTGTVAVPAGTYTLELQGTAASGVNVTPYFRTHANWSNVQLPVEASGRANGQLDPKPWTGNQTWTVTMSGAGTHFDLRLTGTAAFTVTRVILRISTSAPTTTTTAVTTPPTTTTPRVAPPVAPGITKFDEFPVSAQTDWHAWWGTPVTFNATTGSMTVNTNTERATKTLPAPLPAGSYELEVQGTAAPGVNVTPYVQTHTNWANYQLPIEAAGRPNGQLDPKPWTAIQYWPVTLGDTSTHLDLRFTATAQFTITRVILRTAPLPTAVTFGVSNAPDAVLPGQSFPITLTNAITGRDTLELLDANGSLLATGMTVQFTATTPATYTVHAKHDGAIVSTTPLTVTPTPTMTITPPNAVVAGEAIPVTISNGIAGHDSVTITNPSGMIIASYPAVTGLQIVAPPTGNYTATLLRDGLTLSSTQFTVNATPTITLNSASGYSEGFPLDVNLTGGTLDPGDRVRIDTIGQADECATCNSNPDVNKQAVPSTYFANTPTAGTYQAKLLRRGHTIALKTFTTVALPSATLTLWRMDPRYDLDYGAFSGASPTSPVGPGCERWWWNHGWTGYSQTYVGVQTSVLVGNQPGAGTTVILNPQDERSFPMDFCPVTDPRATILENQLPGHPKLKLRMSGYTGQPGDYIQVGPSLRVTHDGWFTPADLGTSWKPGFSEVAISYHTTIGGRDTAIGHIETGIVYHPPVNPPPFCVIGPDRYKQITGENSPPVGVFFYIIGDSCNDQYPILVFTSDPQGTQERPGQRYTTGPNAGQIAPNRARNPGGNAENPTDPPDTVDVPVVTAVAGQLG